MLELELTYLVKKLPKEVEGVRPVRILDVYIPEGAAHAKLRLRRKGESYEMTKKTPVFEGEFSDGDFGAGSSSGSAAGSAVSAAGSSGPAAVSAEPDFSAQVEETIWLSAEEFKALEGCSRKRVEKDRYKVEVGGRAAEVDVFRGALEGLVLVDFEFESEEEKRKFSALVSAGSGSDSVSDSISGPGSDLADFILADVTREEFVAGGYLAGRSYEEIEERLKGFGYERLGKK